MLQFINNSIFLCIKIDLDFCFVLLVEKMQPKLVLKLPTNFSRKIPKNIADDMHIFSVIIRNNTVQFHAN